MPDPCQRYDCCGDESYTYNVTRATPNPQPIIRYALELSVDPTNSGTVMGAGSWAANTFATITASPATGYAFSSWSGDIESNLSSVAVFMDSDKTIVANFVLQTLYLTLSSDPDGSATLTGSGEYAYGATATIEAIPLGDFEFDSWSGDIASINNPEDVLMDQNKSIVANMSRRPYELTISANPSGAGSPVGGGSYLAGQVVSISSNPSSEFCFHSWTGDVNSAIDPESVTMNANKSVVANYVPVECCTGYVMVLVLDQTSSIGAGGAAAGIEIIDTANIQALGVVSFGDSICDIYPITTDLAAVRDYLEDAIANPGTSSFFCDGGGDIPENGVDALNQGFNMLAAYSSSLPKAIYFKTDTGGYAHETSDPATVNTQLNSSVMTKTFLEFDASNTSGDDSGEYATTFPETDKITWTGFPVCTPP